MPMTKIGQAAIATLRDAPDDLPTDLQLGRKVELPKSPDEAKLDWVRNLVEQPYQVRLVCPEFTSLCPVTGQPDFATLIIDYVPGNSVVESKSLKLLLGSFRNTGSFHEAIVNEIADRIFSGRSKYVRVIGYFTARGGIALQPCVERGTLPHTVELRPLPHSLLSQ